MQERDNCATLDRYNGSYEIQRVADSTVEGPRHTNWLIGVWVGKVPKFSPDGHCQVLRDQAVPISTVVGHAGNLVFGKLAGKKVVVMQGRCHPYEGYTMSQVTLPVRVMKLLGVETLIVTNAAGGLNPNYNAGDLMIIKDHINMLGMTGLNPLVGPNDDRFGPRFPDMTNIYTKELRELAKTVGKEMHIEDILQEGIYLAEMGPTYETIAESRFARLMGADAAGMSTAHETIVAKHAGMKVFAMSLITNKIVIEEDSDEDVGDENAREDVKASSLLVSPSYLPSYLFMEPSNSTNDPPGVQTAPGSAKW
ncbi:purine nucleoside phosphorylase [Echinococcus multilocularis]|uniref:purine-nucleoside phosphorylase n=1 Tax=Echinococcus multilocularis TaxID=6211 RepID=A0A068Y9F5_ECHMU|nr:purine nucleoside phosphorylase [Echinococcus multilocularis]